MFCIFCACKGQEEIKALTPEEFNNAISNDSLAVILDVRQPSEYYEGHLPNAILLNYLDTESFEEGLNNLDKNKNYYIYCRSGRRSHNAAVMMQKQGFKIYDMKGGILGWNKYNLPTVK